MSELVAIEQFRNAIKDAGLTPPEHLVADGELHRFGTNGKSGDLSGWYCLHTDGLPAGAFGCWRSEVSSTWRADVDREVSAKERAEQRKRLADIERARKADEKQRHENARQQAAQVWDSAKPAPDDHVYLVRKGVRAHGLRVRDGKLLVPMKDTAGVLHSLQTIGGDGSKLFMRGGRVQGCFFTLGEIRETVLICEGFATGATLYEATGHAVIIAFNCGNLEPVAHAIHKANPRARLVVCADDDHLTDSNPGVTKAREAAAAVDGTLVVPTFPSARPDKATDFNDLAALIGAEGVRRQIRRAHEPRNSRFTVKWARDIEPRLDALWRVQEMLPQSGLAVVFGESGSGKTYIALHLVAHIAAGLDWFGRRCKAGVVVYVAAENPASAENRIAALRVHCPEFADIPLAVLPNAINLFEPTADLPDLLALLSDIETSVGQIAVVVVDTLARAMAGGSENDAADMGRVIASCDRIREEYRTLVLLVHHSGKDQQRGARGHSSLKAAADVELEVTTNGVTHTATLTKSRDGAAGGAFSFRLKPVPLGLDDIGEAITACLVEELADEAQRPAQAAQARLTASQRIALDALHWLLASHEKRRSAPLDAISGGAKIGQYVVTVEDWRQACYFRGISDRAQNAKRMAFNRACSQLQAAHRVQIGGEFVWLSDE